MATTVTRMPYCMCYVRHIDGIEYHLNDVLAPRYVDVIEHNNIRTIDRAKNRRLQELKVISCVNSLHTHGLRRRNDGSLLVIGESVHVCRVQFWSCRSGSNCCTARHQGC